jgi:hypothetical protein
MGFTLIWVKQIRPNPPPAGEERLRDMVGGWFYFLVTAVTAVWPARRL